MVEINRRLAGILAADGVSYSAQMGEDDVGTLTRVRTLRSDVIELLAITHGGRLFRSMGDGFLLEFASAVQALQCAIAIQTVVNTQADGLRLRIGVHQGEVVPEGDDLFGDGVIIAARLEPPAERGGIMISPRVMEDASGKIALEVDDPGEPELKNIAAKIRAFRVRLRRLPPASLSRCSRPRGSNCMAGTEEQARQPNQGTSMDVGSVNRFRTWRPLSGDVYTPSGALEQNQKSGQLTCYLNRTSIGVVNRLHAARRVAGEGK